MSAYPNREPFYSHKITRLLFKSCAAQSLGQDAVLLIIHIAHTEDAAKYQGPVRFWNSQLNEVLGFRSPKSLNNARKKAEDAGWLIYDRKNDRTDGMYWTTIPEHVTRFDDAPIEPNNHEETPGPVSVPSTESIPCTEQKTERERETLRNGKEKGNDPPPIPIPKPKTYTDDKSSESVSSKSKKPKPKPKTMAGFDQWYALYPKKVDRGDAEKAYPKAIADIQATDRLDSPKAVAELLRLTIERLPSMVAKEDQYRKHPATWLSAKGYRDEIVNRRSDERDEYQNFTGQGAKRA